MRNSIIQNLIDLQRESAAIAGIPYKMNSQLFSVGDKYDVWPCSLIGTTALVNLVKIVEQIDQKLLPPFWTMDNKNSEIQINFLQKNGFKEVSRWEGMALTEEHYISKPQTISDFNVISVQADEMDEWYQIMKKVMLPNKSISKEMLQNWVINKHFDILWGKEGETPVSTGMSYTFNGTSGLYFIATLPEYSGKGYAMALVNQLINNCFEKGIEEIILHASQAGLKLYQKLGFEEEGAISSFWKVGIF